MSFCSRKVTVIFILWREDWGYWRSRKAGAFRYFCWKLLYHNVFLWCPFCGTRVSLPSSFQRSCWVAFDHLMCMSGLLATRRFLPGVHGGSCGFGHWVGASGTAGPRLKRGNTTRANVVLLPGTGPHTARSNSLQFVFDFPKPCLGPASEAYDAGKPISNTFSHR